MVYAKGFFYIGTTNILQFVGIVLLLIARVDSILIFERRIDTPLVRFCFLFFVLDLFSNVFAFIMIFSTAKKYEVTRSAGVLLTGIFFLLSFSWRQMSLLFDAEIFGRIIFLSSFVFGLLLLLVVQVDPLLHKTSNHKGKMEFPLLAKLIIFLAISNMVVSLSLVLLLPRLDFYTILPIFVFKMLLPIISAPIFIGYGIE